METKRLPVAAASGIMLGMIGFMGAKTMISSPKKRIVVLVTSAVLGYVAGYFLVYPIVQSKMN